VKGKETLSSNKTKEDQNHSQCEVKDKKGIGFQFMGGAGMIPLSTQYNTKNNLTTHWAIHRP